MKALKKKTISERLFNRKYYKRWIALGGVIVSLALAAKDREQEHLREYAGKVESAETLFRIQELQRSMILRIDNLRKNVHFTQTRVQGTDIDPKIGEWYALGETYVDSLQTTLDANDRATNWFELLPLNELPKEREKLAEAHQETYDLMAEAHQITVDSISKKLPNKNRVAMIDAEADLIRMETKGITSRLFKALDAHKRYLQQRFLLVSFMCYAMLMIGFMLSLTGHLVGKDEELPEIKL